MKYKIKGFTLIELMIVVAVIGVLAFIAIPAYFDYQSKAKVTAGLAEISGGKTNFEIERDNDVNVTTPGQIGLKTSTSNCNISVANDGITCQLANAPSPVNAKSIKLERAIQAGEWQCIATAIDSKYKPKACS